MPESLEWDATILQNIKAPIGEKQFDRRSPVCLVISSVDTDALVEKHKELLKSAKMSTEPIHWLDLFQYDNDGWKRSAYAASAVYLTGKKKLQDAVLRGFKAVGNDDIELKTIHLPNSCFSW